MSSLYQINKGINKSIEFKGLKAQYIWYFAGGVIALLVLFAILYIIGIPALICITIIGILGVLVTYKIYGLSNQYGEHGMMKAAAKRNIPPMIKSRNRRIFRVMGAAINANKNC